MRSLLHPVAVLGMVALGVVAAGPEDAATRGKRALLTKSYNPATLPLGNYSSAWKHWGRDKAPAPEDYDRLFRERYGLHPAPYPNQGMPMGMRLAERGTPFGTFKGLSTDCLICHGGSIFGQSYVGLGNSTLDFQAFYEELAGLTGRRVKPPFQFTNVRGTVEAGAMGVYLLGFREPDLSLRLVRRDLDLQDDLCEDVPAWWILKKKKTMYYTGGADTRSARALMQFMMSPFNPASAFPAAEKDFQDIRAFLMSLQPPKYPLPVDPHQVEKGAVVFAANCSHCHGTYGDRPTYPNKIVPLKDIGTDPRRFHGITQKFADSYGKSWFGEMHKPITTDGYQAPPLDGIWATAPYLHNGSVPTLYHVLHSPSRPVRFTRSFATTREAYDDRKVGWKFREIASPADPRSMDPFEFRKVYDTTLPGRSNTGHRYGDSLSEDERLAVIEYLKTL